MKILTKITFTTVLSLALFSTGACLIASEFNKNQIIDSARNTANYVRDVGAWASQYGTIYTKDSKSTHLAESKVGEFTAQNLGKPFTEEEILTVSYFSKNPALIQRELSDVVAKSDNAVKFRLTAENYMNPNNKPTPWELNSIYNIKSKRLDEYGEFKDGYYLYAKTLYIKPACLKCHGEPDLAPEGVTKQYGTMNGFGFKEGDVSGIISVKVPYSNQLNVMSALKTLNGVLALLFILASGTIPLIVYFTSIVVPIKKEIKVIEKLAKGAVLKSDLEPFPEKSLKEIGQLQSAISSLVDFLTNSKRRNERNKEKSKD
jgi:hypothetical protein